MQFKVQDWSSDINYTKLIYKQVKRKKICIKPCVLPLPLFPSPSSPLRTQLNTSLAVGV